MERPTKVQTTVDFDTIPQIGQNHLREKAFPTLRSALAELNHLISEHKPEEVSSSTVLYHIDQARKKMFTADLFLQDIQQMISGYVQVQEESQPEPVENSTEDFADLVGKTGKLNAAIDAVKKATVTKETKPDDTPNQS